MEAGERKERVPKQRKYHSWNYFPNRTCPGLRCRKQQSPKLHNQPQFLLSS
uniref:Uncharacterized protein n=1 Tax=Propithecus coquereli TaxID=379532 RepID=A0A2K6FUL2_PROCO